MAEAVVEDPHRFFCHKCSCEISSVLPDYTCPRCCSGFIEALDSQPAATDHGDESDEDIDNVQPWELLNDVFLMGMNGDPVLDSRRGHRGRDGERRPGRNNRTRHTFENLMHLVVMNLNGADLGPHGSMQGGRGGGLGSEIFVGNPGDYAWGREGFDAIVTQLLNQIESTGPPPLTKEKISEIPTVLITQEEVDKSLQCSVCWENFKCDEPVRKLVCTHVYHEGCIIPWLELHGTCPVCRKPLSSEEEQATTDDGGRRQETLRSLAAHLTGSQQNPLTSQFRNLHWQMDDFRRNSPRTPGDASSSNRDGLSSPAMQNLEDVSSSGTSSSSLSRESGSSDGNSSSTNTSTGCNGTQGNIQDMDVD